MPRHYREELLTQRETFERYERPSSASYNPPAVHGQLACEYRQAVPQPTIRTTSHNQSGPQLACEYRRPYDGGGSQHGQLACEYRAIAPQNPNQLACEYREDPRLSPVQAPRMGKAPTSIRTYFPSTSQKKVPLGLIVGIAIAIPILIIIILFGAVWLQELGIL